MYESIPQFRPPIPKEYAFSYAGLKSGVERQTAKLFPNLKKPIPRDIARAMARRFQEAAVQQIIDKMEMVLDQFEGRGLNGRASPIKIRSIAASGGVASNSYLRAQ